MLTGLGFTGRAIRNPDTTGPAPGASHLIWDVLRWSFVFLIVAYLFGLVIALFEVFAFQTLIDELVGDEQGRSRAVALALDAARERAETPGRTPGGLPVGEMAVKLDRLKGAEETLSGFAGVGPLRNIEGEAAEQRYRKTVNDLLVTVKDLRSVMRRDMEGLEIAERIDEIDALAAALPTMKTVGAAEPAAPSAPAVETRPPGAPEAASGGAGPGGSTAASVVTPAPPSEPPTTAGDESPAGTPSLPAAELERLGYQAMLEKTLVNVERAVDELDPTALEDPGDPEATLTAYKQLSQAAEQLATFRTGEFADFLASVDQLQSSIDQLDEAVDVGADEKRALYYYHILHQSDSHPECDILVCGPALLAGLRRDRRARQDVVPIPQSPRPLGHRP